MRLQSTEIGSIASLVKFALKTLLGVVVSTLIALVAGVVAPT